MENPFANLTQSPEQPPAPSGGPSPYGGSGLNPPPPGGLPPPSIPPQARVLPPSSFITDADLPPIQPKRPSPRGPLIGVGIGIAAILLLGGGAFAAAQMGWIELPFLGPSAKTVADRIVTSAQSITSTVQSVTVELSVEPAPAGTTTIFVTTNANGSPAASNTNFSLRPSNVAGTYQNLAGFILAAVPPGLSLNLASTIYSETNVNGSLDANLTGSYANGTTRASVTFQVRRIGSDLYFNVTDISGVPGLTASDRGKILNRWIVDTHQEGAQQLLGSFVRSTSTANSGSLTPSELKDLVASTIQSGFFTLDAKLGSETVGGVKTNHYRVGLHADHYADLVAAELAAAKSARAAANTNLATVNVNAATAPYRDPAFVSFLDRVLKNTSIEAWIDPKTGLYRKASATVTLLPPASATALAGKAIVLSFTSTTEKVNEPQTVSAPSPTTSLTDELLQLQPETQNANANGNTNTATGTNTNTATTDWNLLYTCLPAGEPSKTVDSDYDGLSDYLEVFTYHTNPCKADTDGDGFTDGAEVQNGYNPNGPGKL